MAPVGVGGLFDSEAYRGSRGTPHQLELLARAEVGPNATPGCAQVSDRNLNAIRLSD